MKIKIAVMAGTPVDTRMGADLLFSNGFSEVLEIPISLTPIEQTAFQVSNMKYKEKVIREHLKEIMRQGCSLLFVYCNSLSGAVDFDKISQKTSIRIITPLHIYREMAEKYENIGIISANAQGLSGIEKVIYQKNNDIKIIGITLLEMVKEIEKRTKPENIAEKFALKNLMEYFEVMRVQKIILGCTHFPYVEEEIRKISGIEILNPGMGMIEKIYEIMREEEDGVKSCKNKV